MPRDTHEFLTRLVAATNDHDLEGVVGCFTADYRNETPVHPARAFRGNEQVRTNWQQIFGLVPDVRATVLASAGDAAALWSEWEMTGTRRDGSPHLMRGVIVFGLTGAQAHSARFYLEPVDPGPGTVDEAVRAVHAAPTT